jgi:hypothetical protein
VLGTTGGDREKLVSRHIALHSNCAQVLAQVSEAVAARAYAVIAPQMGMQLVAFQVSFYR